VIRLFVSADLQHGAGEITLSGEQAHYLVSVMRLKPGAQIAVFNGRDGEAMATLKHASARKATLALGARTRAFEPPPDLWLLLALVKRGPLETIIEKAVELGARRVQILLTRRTNAERTNLERLTRIAIEAAEQTGRLDVPEIVEPVRLERLLDSWDGSRRVIFCDEAGDDPSEPWGGPQGRAMPALEALRQVHAPLEGGGKPWAVLIGPEGGFDPEERERLRSLPFVTPVTLGPRILRADTAAIAALTLWQAALGDWRAP
jgi:16S rRNA (uracil1498-N3)-methyltransferase